MYLAAKWLLVIVQLSVGSGRWLTSIVGYCLKEFCILHAAVRCYPVMRPSAGCIFFGIFCCFFPLFFLVPLSHFLTREIWSGLEITVDLRVVIHVIENIYTLCIHKRFVFGYEVVVTLLFYNLVGH